MKEFQLMFILSLLVNAYLQGQICSYGTTIQGTVEADHLTKLTVVAQINEYAWTDTVVDDRTTASVFNTIHFTGEEGSTYIDFGINNSILQFEPYPNGNDTIHYANINDVYKTGIGFYFWGYHNQEFLTGVDVLPTETTFPRFANLYESGHFYRGEKKEHFRIGTYSRDAVHLDNTDSPAIIKWIIEKKGRIVDPDIQSINFNNLQFNIFGDYVIWNIQMQINGNIINVADYYIPYKIASYLHPSNPLDLGHRYNISRHHDPRHRFVHNIEYTELSVENETGETVCIDEFEIMTSNIDIICNLDLPSYGWTVQNKHLTSIAHHEEIDFNTNSIGYRFDDESIQYCSIDKQTTSIDNIDYEKTRICPNPVSDILHIQVADSKSYSVVIYNINGQNLLESNSLQSIDMTSFDSGIYFLQISDPASSFKSVHKIVKQ